jgi:hypothetical protein
MATIVEIQPDITNIDSYCEWLGSQTANCEALIQNRKLAIESIQCDCETIALAAIKSFIYFWSFKGDCLDALATAAMISRNDLIRLWSVTAICIALERCEVHADRQVIKDRLTIIGRSMPPGDISDIITINLKY